MPAYQSDSMDLSQPQHHRVSNAVSIADLPNELLIQVLNHLANDEIINLSPQFVARGLPHSSFPIHFGRLEVVLQRQSVEMLVRISCHQHIAKHVNQLCLLVDRLDSLGPELYLECHWKTHTGYHSVSCTASAAAQNEQYLLLAGREGLSRTHGVT